MVRPLFTFRFGEWVPYWKNKDFLSLDFTCYLFYYDPAPIQGKRVWYINILNLSPQFFGSEALNKGKIYPQI